MKKGQACIVQGCKSTKRSMRHRFPKDPIKSYIWSCAVKNLELQQMSVEQRQKFYVCQQHFPQEAYKVTLSRCHLMDTAVPSLNIPGESSSTLMKSLCNVPVKTGIMSEVIQHLQDKVQQMKDDREKVCILIWDEVALEPHIEYDAAADRIVGFEDWGIRRSKNFADHCLVFMIKGLYSGWKVPVSYNFCESQTSSAQLIYCIKEVIRAIQSTGLQIVASVCDQGGSNMSAIENLLLETNTKCFHRGEQPGDAIEIDQTTFYHIYDVPHLLKETRNNLLTKDLQVDLYPDEVRKYIVGKGKRRFASWDIIQLAYTIDTNGPSRQLKKLTDEHIICDKINKIKVKYATQVFSETLANYIEFTSTISGHINSRIGPLKMPEIEGLETASTLKFFNNLFDSLNGHKKSSGLGLKGLLTSTSEHHTFWPEACRKLTGMRFVKKDSKESNSETDVPTMRNWVTTIASVRNVWKVVHAMGFEHLETRHLNQDCLENFFEQMRSHGGRNVTPNCAQFQESFKTSLINNLMSKHSVGANLENKKSLKF